MQLYACLESIDRHVAHASSKIVIYRSSNEEYERAYAQVRQDFPAFIFKRQSDHPKEDFKPLVLESVFRRDSSSYIAFLVDDNIVKDAIDLDLCVHALEKQKAYAFYLKLGLHVNQCYTLDMYQGVPSMKEVEKGIYSWKINEGIADWGYPNTVDMAVYRKEEIEQVLRDLAFHNPNTFEGHWAEETKNDWVGLCFKTSKVINTPSNVVNEDWVNRNMDSYTPLELLKLFQEGWKIDISPFFQIKNRAVHVEYDFSFISRSA
jgi:hypothetical protein